MSPRGFAHRVSAAMFAVLVIGIALPAAGNEHAGHDAMHAGQPDLDKIWKAALARAPLAVSATFDRRGRLWRASVRDGHVYVQYSDDKGGSFSAPVRVNPQPELVAADGENRPKLVVGAHGEVYVSYTQSLPTPMTGNVRFSRSTDGGRSFSAPLTVNDDHEIISHRFDAMVLDGRGHVVIAWLDKRDQQAARAKGEPYAGAALYYAVSGGGANFEANRKIADHSCECCRVAIALDTDGVPVVFWRQIFGKNVRDHALRRLDGVSPMRRVSRDDWKVDACPHHGPAIAVASDGTYHLAWFSGAPANPGLFYARSGDRGRSVSTPLRFGDPDAQAAHPQVLAIGPRVYLGWKEFDGQASVVRVMVSHDGGRHWSMPWNLATATSTSDHPLLIEDGKTAYLSWNSLKEGYRLIAIPDDPPRP